MRDIRVLTGGLCGRRHRCGRSGCAGVDVDLEEFGGVEEDEEVGAEVDDGCLDGADEAEEGGGDAEDVDDADADEQVFTLLLADDVPGSKCSPPPVSGGPFARNPATC